MNNDVVTFSKKWFNPLYFILNDIVKDDNIRTVFVYGGKSSAKTHSICQILSKQSALYGEKTIGFRKESTSLKTTLKETFKKAIDTCRLQNGFLNLEFEFRSTINGSHILLKGLDSDEKAKGVESYKYLFFDELNHFHEAEFEQYQLSLRGMKGQKIFGAWNPVSDQSWIKVNYIDKIEWKDTDWKLPSPDSFVRISADGKTILIKTDYRDNYWITGSPCGTFGFRDEAIISQYLSLKDRNYNSYKVNVLGEWGKVDFGGEFLKCWNSSIHTSSKVDYNPNLAVWLSFDENVNPYFPCGIFQVSEDLKTIYLIDSIAAKNPNNTVKWVCAEISRKLQTWGHKEAVYICGDATSQKDDVKLEKGHNLFKLIRIELEKYKPVLKLSASNPSVRMSADFFNAVLESNYEGLTFMAAERNRTAILDYENTKEDKNGKIDKAVVKDPVTKVSYQPFGHFVDLTRYVIVEIWRKQYELFQRGGKMHVPTFLPPVQNNKLRF